MKILFALMVIGVFGGIIALVVRGRREKKRQDDTYWLRLKTVEADFVDKYNKVLGLQELFCIEETLREIFNKKHNLMFTAPNSDISATISGLEDMNDDMDRYIRNPDIYFKKKFYDFLDDSLLTEPVDLAINHPELGPVTVKVNRVSAEKYVAAAKAGKKVDLKGDRPMNHQTLVRSNSAQISNHYSTHRDDGFGVLDYYILYSLLCGGHGSHDSCLNDVGFVGQGGQFAGAGASGDFYVEAAPVQVAEANATDDTGVLNSVVGAAIVADAVNEQVAESQVEHADQVVADSSVVESQSAESIVDAVANAETSSSLSEGATTETVNTDPVIVDPFAVEKQPSETTVETAPENAEVAQTSDSVSESAAVEADQAADSGSPEPDSYDSSDSSDTSGTAY